ncbi:MAG: hypothetical protein JNM84_08560 [Planctomycetes bacterium]|nr:hypothetical protein [Planctomycetota bacterium]
MVPPVRKEAVKGRFSFRSRARSFVLLAAALAGAGCSAVEKPLAHRRALERLALLESLDEHQANELALGVEVACELLLVDAAAPAFARHRAAVELGRWGRALRTANPSRGTSIAGADRVDRQREALLERALIDIDERRAAIARGDTLRTEHERRLRGTLAELGALRGGSLATQIRSLALCGALLQEAPSAALRAELDAAGRALAAEALPTVLIAALRGGERSPAVRVALAESWLSVRGEEEYATIFACCREDASEELRSFLVAQSSRLSQSELESSGALAWLLARAEDEPTPSSRFARRALRSLGLEAPDP